MSPFVKLSGGLDDFKLAEHMVKSPLRMINSRVKWIQQALPKKKCTLPVEGAPDGTVIEMTVLEKQPSEPRVVYRHASGWVRRLCVNGSHGNILGTHKHRIALGGEDAYEPDDIPLIPLQPYVRAGAYREIMEAFIAECNIAIGDDYQWTDPY